ncbi:Pentatricopeptide repeat [Dillenia turbinata]|uniref:Pentatricopeptide repeat n=1 Tax=Dillenia turbinata TaxID=194707 RepID=A0AAN8Z4X2_9MAGN
MHQISKCVLKLTISLPSHKTLTSFFIRFRPCTLTTIASPETAQPQEIQIANTVLQSHNLKTVNQEILSVEWTPDLVHRVLKRLWNPGPKALQFFKFLDHHPNYSHSSTAFDHAIDLAARIRDYKTIWTLLARMQARRIGPSPETFAIVAERFVSAGKTPQRNSGYFILFYFVNRFRADTVSYNIIANGWCLVKRTPKALEVLKDMVEKMKKRKCELDVISYTTVVHGFGVAGEVDKARGVFGEMVKDGVLPSVATYNALIQVFCKKDSVENAIVVFEEMVRKGYVPNSVTYNLVIRGLCHVGQMDRAVQFMGRMKDDECDPNVQTYNLFICYYCNEGEIEKGLEVFEKTGSGNCLPNLDTYNILLSSMFVRKKPDDLLVAGKLLIEMVNRGYLPRKFTFNRVLNGLLLTGNQDFAKEILRLQSKCGRLPRHFKL